MLLSLADQFLDDVIRDISRAVTENQQTASLTIYPLDHPLGVVAGEMLELQLDVRLFQQLNRKLAASVSRLFIRGPHEYTQITNTIGQLGRQKQRPAAVPGAVIKGDDRPWLNIGFDKQHG